MNEFEHERLDVYKAAIELLVLADAVAAALPRGRGYLADQLRRAASSISFNIAEGARGFASDENDRFYRMARRSATESAALFDACRVLWLTTEPSAQAGRAILLRIVAMLKAMVKKSGSGAGSGSGSG
jgi:four helix bundle protein